MKKWLPVGAIAAALILLGVVEAGHTPSAPLDPDGTGPAGAKALVLLLRQYGARVDLVDGAPDSSTATALVLTDQLDTGRRGALAAWVAAGGRLVVADPGSPLQTGAPTGVDETHPGGACPLVRGIDKLDVGPSYFLRDEANQGTGCFGTNVPQGATAGQAWFLLARAVGRGQVIGLGGGGLWANQLLDHDANAALAVGLLVPGGPGSRVAILVRSHVGSGHASAYHLLSPRVRAALWELVIAFGVLALWRGRRFGRPVTEPQPVEVEASELVGAVGELLHQSRNRTAAAAQLRQTTRGWLAGRLGLPPTAGAGPITDALIVDDPQHVRGLLTDTSVRDDDELVSAAAGLAELRRQIDG